MYLKSIEMHGFKSFAGRIQLTFDDGITGIVGPNGSGKSNVSDAVRWVLGEQSAKTLRGSNMQDVIFSGTESRKALSFAYVCITLDNSDHKLPLDYDEVSVSRRIYSSGESEYQINKTNCRLKDIQELFYDTGIGKEGYSIIGQGQIERILSSKPEDRREIFDEAVGIVKYKKRKEASLKRLQEEEDNLTRIEDVLSELTDRIEPLRQQAQTAREFLSIKERQKTLDINLFLLESREARANEEKLKEAKETLTKDLSDFRSEQEKNNAILLDYSKSLKVLEDSLIEKQNLERSLSEKKSGLTNEINILQERINSSKTLLSTSSEREEELKSEIESKKMDRKALEEKLSRDEKSLQETEKRVQEASTYRSGLSDKIKALNTRSEELTKEQLALMEGKVSLNSDRQRFETEIEQTKIKKAELTQKQLETGTENEELSKGLETALKEFDEKTTEKDDILKKEEELLNKREDLSQKMRTLREETEENRRKLSSLRTKRETIKNIAERYEGYGGAVRHVMNKKDELKGVIGVVADLIRAKKAHEMAIETALGGAIQNIVTKDEPSARRCVDYLKQNRHGRATFLPVTAVRKTETFRFEEALGEKGVLGLASDLVECERDYRDICEYLLGRVVVADNMDSALALAKKYSYKLNIVTLEGEQLRPGGSITGGAYKQSSNLLGRSRELTELLENIKVLEEEIDSSEKKLSDYATARELTDDDIKEISSKKEEALLELNTLAINLKNIETRLSEVNELKEKLRTDKSDLESRLSDLNESLKTARENLENSDKRRVEIEEELNSLQSQIDENNFMEGTASRNFAEMQIEEANAKSEVSHTKENIERLLGEIQKVEEDLSGMDGKRDQLNKEIADNEARIKLLGSQMGDSDSEVVKLSEDIEKTRQQQNEKKAKNREILDRRDELSGLINNLEKEEIRLDSQLEKVVGDRQRSSDHIWEEYQLTYHNALEYENEDFTDIPVMKKELSDIAVKLRDMGSVNVNAIDEYSQVSERYEFLTSQCEDLKEGREKLLGIIEDLNFEMKERFEKGFEKISKEFDQVFKELFGGGTGKLSLSNENDILESGISIVAQPPGKKLSNMMQMSGGEKSLVAICILFAILNLKPSPFCLLDEIEAALDEPNVERFAKYLNKLTDNTQFIIITHRRGTMNEADRLYGITMQEKGISTLVSVNLIEEQLED